jgi:hypothetical protein
MPADSSREPQWWDFIAHRRRYVSDLVWYGLVFLAVGYGVFVDLSGWARILSAAFALVGVAMIAAGVKRRLHAWRQGANQQASEQLEPDRGGGDPDQVHTPALE